MKRPRFKDGDLVRLKTYEEMEELYEPGSSNLLDVHRYFEVVKHCGREFTIKCSAEYQSEVKDYGYSILISRKNGERSSAWFYEKELVPLCKNY